MNGPLIVASAASCCSCRSSTMPTPLVHMTANGPVPRRQLVSDASEPDAPNINGTAGEDGALGATIGFQPVRGRFIKDEFEGTFKSFDCVVAIG